MRPLAVTGTQMGADESLRPDSRGLQWESFWRENGGPEIADFWSQREPRSANRGFLFSPVTPHT